MFVNLSLIAALAAAVAQAQSTLEQATQSPSALIDYINRNGALDWKAFWRITGLEQPAVPAGLCNPTNPCRAELIKIPDPNQAIVLIGGEVPRDDLYLRFQREAEGLWKITGQHFTFVKEYPRHHQQATIGDRPYLKLWTDQSQVGFALLAKQEQWFDLTSPDFAPVFSFIAEGSYSKFSFAVQRSITTTHAYSQLPGEEQIDLTINVRFGGLFEPSSACTTTLRGLYSRPAGARSFTLKTTKAGNIEMPVADFMQLGGSALDLENHRVLRYAFPCLKAIASGADESAKEFLRNVLAGTKDCAEKTALRALLSRMPVGRP